MHRIEIEARPRTRGSGLVAHCRAAHWRFAVNDSFFAT